jgi:hypothetical protein
MALQIPADLQVLLAHKTFLRTGMASMHCSRHPIARPAAVDGALGILPNRHRVVTHVHLKKTANDGKSTRSTGSQTPISAFQ